MSQAEDLLDERKFYSSGDINIPDLIDDVVSFLPRKVEAFAAGSTTSYWWRQMLWWAPQFHAVRFSLCPNRCCSIAIPRLNDDLTFINVHIDVNSANDSCLSYLKHILQREYFLDRQVRFHFNFTPVYVDDIERFCAILRNAFSSSVVHNADDSSTTTRISREQLPELHALKFKCSLLRDSHFAPIRQLNFMMNLRKLELCECTRMYDIVMDDVASLINLEELILWGCESFSDFGFARLKRLPHLRVLKASNGHSVSDQGIKHLSSCRTLRELHLWSFNVITDTSLSFVAELLVDLRCLRLIDCHRLTDHGLRSLVPLQKLVELNVAACPKISSSVIRELDDLFPYTVIKRTLPKEM